MPLSCAQSREGLPRDAAVDTYPGPTAAYFSMFHSQTSVDGRAVQLGGIMTFFIAVACAVFAGRYVTEWVVSALSVSLGGGVLYQADAQEF